MRLLQLIARAFAAKALSPDVANCIVEGESCMLAMSNLKRRGLTAAVWLFAKRIHIWAERTPRSAV